MLLKRTTPSFTVEFRQAKRRKPGSPRTDWLDAKGPPTTATKQPQDIAVSTFKPAADNVQIEGRAPSTISGRILPSLLKMDSLNAPPISGTSRGTCSPRRAKNVSKDPEPGFGATKAPPEQMAEQRADLRQVGKARPKRPARSPADRGGELAGAPLASLAPMAGADSRSDFPSIREPIADARKARVLSRYIFRDEFAPTLLSQLGVDLLERNRIGAMRPVSNAMGRQLGAFANSSAIACAIDAVLLSRTTSPSRSRTQMCVSSIEMSRPAKYSIERSPLPNRRRSYRAPWKSSRSGSRRLSGRAEGIRTDGHRSLRAAWSATSTCKASG